MALGLQKVVVGRLNEVEGLTRFSGERKWGVFVWAEKSGRNNNHEVVVGATLIQPSRIFGFIREAELKIVNTAPGDIRYCTMLNWVQDLR